MDVLRLIPLIHFQLVALLGQKGVHHFFAPAGLDLGAETPEELALAVVSEIQAVFAGASAESLRDRKAPIHGWNIVRRSAPKECATLPL